MAAAGFDPTSWRDKVAAMNRIILGTEKVGEAPAPMDGVANVDVI